MNNKFVYIYNLLFIIVISIHTNATKIQKVIKFTQLSFKTTHISWCKNVYICIFATITMHICTVTVAVYNNTLLFFHLSFVKLLLPPTFTTTQ